VRDERRAYAPNINTAANITTLAIIDLFSRNMLCPFLAGCMACYHFILSSIELSIFAERLLRILVIEYSFLEMQTRPFTAKTCPVSTISRIEGFLCYTAGKYARQQNLL